LARRSELEWDGPLTTAFVSSTKLIAVVPAANVATAGTAQVTAKNPTGSASNAVTIQPLIIRCRLRPSLNPNSAGCASFTMTVNGHELRFYFDGEKWNATTLATHFVSSTQLTATVTAALVASSRTTCLRHSRESPLPAAERPMRRRLPSMSPPTPVILPVLLQPLAL